jgi:hypothetical protein
MNDFYGPEIYPEALAATAVDQRDATGIGADRRIFVYEITTAISMTRAGMEGNRHRDC